MKIRRFRSCRKGTTILPGPEYRLLYKYYPIAAEHDPSRLSLLSDGSVSAETTACTPCRPTDNTIVRGFFAKTPVCLAADATAAHMPSLHHHRRRAPVSCARPLPPGCLPQLCIAAIGGNSPAREHPSSYINHGGQPSGQEQNNSRRSTAVAVQPQRAAACLCLRRHRPTTKIYTHKKIFSV